jgi:hypothetical protein
MEVLRQHIIHGTDAKYGYPEQKIGGEDFCWYFVYSTQLNISNCCSQVISITMGFLSSNTKSQKLTRLYCV